MYAPAPTQPVGHGLSRYQCRIYPALEDTQKHLDTIQWDTSLKEWANAWAPKEPRPISVSIAALKDHILKSILTDPRSTRAWEQHRLPTSISRRLATTCPKDSQTMCCLQASAKTLSFAILLTFSGYWAINAHQSVSEGCEAILRVRVVR